MKIRTADCTDHSGIKAVLDAAFGQGDENRIVERLRADDADSLELVADHHGGILGAVMFSPANARLTDGRVLRGLGLGPVAVKPDHQNKGIGTALIEAGLEHFQPYPVAFFCVLGAPDYYARFGFSPAIERGWRWAADNGTLAEMAQAFQIRLPRSLPAGDGVIHYHPAFGL